MVSRHDIQRLIHNGADSESVLSVFLDMSVNESNKRTYRTFLSQERSRRLGLDGDRPAHPHDPLGVAFDRVQQWIDDQFDVANKGAAIYVAIGGEWFDGLQFPAPIANRIEIGPHPVVGPVVQLLVRTNHYGVIVVDREWLRLIDLQMGDPVAEYEVKASAYPSRSSVKKGGEAAKGYQKFKAEEARRFAREFVGQIGVFVDRHRPEALILLGTEDNVQRLQSELTPELRDMVVHTDNAPVEPTSAAVAQRLAPMLEELAARAEAETIDLLRDRVQQNYLAVKGFSDTLLNLQEGKLNTLIMARTAQRSGGHCQRCGVFLATMNGACNYCGGQVDQGVDLVETMIRLAAEQEVDITFGDASIMADLDETGGLLRF